MVEKKTTRQTKAKDASEESEATESTAEEAQGGEEAQSSGTGEAAGKKSVEERLDEFGDRFSKAMMDGVKRLEGAFDKGMQNLRDNPDLNSGRVRGFFSSSSGGVVLVVIGFVWFFYAVGLLDKPIFPILMIILGFYLMYRDRRK